MFGHINKLGLTILVRAWSVCKTSKFMVHYGNVQFRKGTPTIFILAEQPGLRKYPLKSLQGPSLCLCRNISIRTLKLTSYVFSLNHSNADNYRHKSPASTHPPLANIPTLPLPHRIKQLKCFVAVFSMMII